MQIPQDLIETATLKLKSVQSEAEFFKLRAQYLGKKSFVVSAFSKLRDLQSDKKVIAAKELNLLKNKLSKLFEASLADIEGKNNFEKLDVTLPADPYLVGSEHPITKISQKIINYFTALNYQILDTTIEVLPSSHINFSSICTLSSPIFDVKALWLCHIYLFI